MCSERLTRLRHIRTANSVKILEKRGKRQFVHPQLELERRILSWKSLHALTSTEAEAVLVINMLHIPIVYGDFIFVAKSNEVIDEEIGNVFRRYVWLCP